MNYPWSKAFLRTCPRNSLKVRLCNVLLSSCQSSHLPLAHHHPGHYQCFHGVNSHSWVGYPCQCSNHTVSRVELLIARTPSLSLTIQVGPQTRSGTLIPIPSGR